MEKKYKTTEKQLAFLEDYLKRKHPHCQDEVRIELIDHLISDFEATTQNGNLSQYLSDRLGFIRKFSNRGRNTKLNYNKEVWEQYVSFFTTLKLLPITILCYGIIYFSVQILSNKPLLLSFYISVFGLYGFSLFASRIKSKEIRKLKKSQALNTGLGLGIPYIMVMITFFFSEKYFLLQSRFFFSIYWFIAFSVSVAAIIVLFQKKKEILEKHKHLLN